MILILDLIFFFLNFFFSIDSHWGRAGSEGGASGVNVTVLSSSMSSKEALRRQTVSEIWLSLDAVEMRLRQEVATLKKVGVVDSVGMDLVPRRRA